MSKYKICGTDIELIQQKMLNILIEVDRLCNKHNIRYILDAGTLLGAIRHQGFIPWDDDIDIAMPREDYERFRNIAKKELNSPYIFEDYRDREEFPNIFGKCYDTNTKYIEEKTNKLNIQKGIWMDIFPFDYINPKTFKIQNRIIIEINKLRQIKLKICKKTLINYLYLPLLVLPISFINFLCTKIIQCNKKSNYIAALCKFGAKKNIYDINLFINRIKVEFNNYRFFIPENYDSYLKLNYNNYLTLPPLEKQKPSHGVLEIDL